MVITRGYHPEDLTRLFEINDVCYAGVERPSPADFREMLGGEVFVAKDHDAIEGEGPIVGFAILRTDPEPYLWSIAVDPIWQGRGVGGNLLREVIKYCTLRHETGIVLHCKPENPAQKLYFDYGFRVAYRVNKWYGAEGDALCMRRSLP